jgi:hypothetical protein
VQPGLRLRGTPPGRSPGSPNGTSSRRRVLAGRTSRRRRSRASCAASRIGCPFGKARSGTSMPSAEPITARVSYATCGDKPRSIRLSSAIEIQAIALSSRRVIPARSRVSRRSAPSATRFRRASCRPRIVRRSWPGIGAR